MPPKNGIGVAAAVFIAVLVGTMMSVITRGSLKPSNPLMRQAQEYFESGRPESAASLLADETARDPDNVLAHWGYQQTMMGLGKLEPMAAEYRQRLKDRQDGLSYYLFVSSWSSQPEWESVISRAKIPDSDPWMLYARKNVEAGKAGEQADFQRVISVLNSIPEGVGFQPEIEVSRGLAFLGLHRPREAIRECLKAVRTLPIYPDAYACVGAGYQSVSQSEVALHYFRKQALLRPSPYAWGNIAGSLNALGRTKEAAAAVQTALRLPPVTPDDYATRISDELGDPAAATRDLAEMRRRYVGAYTDLMEIYVTSAKNDLAGARRECNALQAAHPDYEGSANICGGLFFAENNFQGAHDAYARLAIMSPDNFYYWFSKGCANTHLNQSEQALSDLLRAHSLAPRYPETNHCLANEYWTLGRYNEALRYSYEAVAVNPEDMDALTTLGGVYKAMQRYPEALDAYDRAWAASDEKSRATIDESRREIRTAMRQTRSAGDRFQTPTMTSTVTDVLTESFRVSKASQKEYTSEDALESMMGKPHSDAYRIIKRMGLDPEGIRSEVSKAAPSAVVKSGVPDRPTFSYGNSNFEDVHRLTTAYLLLGCLEQNGTAASRVLSERGLTTRKLADEISSFYNSEKSED